MALTRPRGPRNELHLAAATGSTAKVKALLASGKININCGDHRGVTPLVFAVEKHPCIVEILLDAGADVTIPDDGGATALHWSAIFGQLCATQMLTEAGAPLEATNINGCTPLQLAGECGHAKVIRALLDAGANVNSRSALGETALYSAAYHGHVHATKELLRWNANPRLGTVIGDEVTQVIRVPLDVAAQHGHEGVVFELLQLGLDACGAATGDALDLACKRQHLGTMMKLRDAGIVDDGSALLTAVTYRGEESLRFLLSQRWAVGAHRHAYVNFCDSKGRTPLLAAIGSESPRIARMLLDAGARPDSPGTKAFNYATPLTLTLTKLGFSTAEDHATKDKRYRLEGIRRLLLRVDAIHAVSWLWPSGACSITGAIEAGIVAQSRSQTLTLPSPRRAMESVSAPGRMVAAKLLRWALVPFPLPRQLLLSVVQGRGRGRPRR
ncbi:unnamed protein product [Scytosiphon promiscuus]